MNELQVKDVTHVTHRGEMSFYIYLFGQMECRKPGFFLALPTEDYPFWEG